MNNVIGSSNGDEINRDINNIQETTKDKDSGHYNTFVESRVLVLATEKGREDFKENVQLAGEEVATVGRVVDTVINKQEEDLRNLSELKRIITEKVRIQIESDNVIFLQKPNSLQQSELALTQINIIEKLHIFIMILIIMKVILRVLAI